MSVFAPETYDADDRSSLISSSSSGPGDVAIESVSTKSTDRRSHISGVTGLALLPKLEFWQLWTMLGALTGVGLMTIKWVQILSRFDLDG